MDGPTLAEFERAPDPLFRDPRFDALRNALYHTARSNFLDRLNRCLNFLVIIFGAGVVSKIAEHGHIGETSLELAVVFVATAQLVFDFGTRARNHEFLQRKYYELLAEMEASDLSDENKRRHWSAKLLTVSAEEPMTMRALDAVAYDKALDATCDDANLRKIYRHNVRGWRYLLRNFWAFHSTDFQCGKT